MHLLLNPYIIRKVTSKEVMKTNQQKKDGNGRKKYAPDVVYEHLGADVWKKTKRGKEKSEVAYTEEIEAELNADNESEPDDEQN